MNKNYSDYSGPSAGYIATGSGFLSTDSEAGATLGAIEMIQAGTIDPGTTKSLQAAAQDVIASGASAEMLSGD